MVDRFLAEAKKQLFDEHNLGSNDLCCFLTGLEEAGATKLALFRQGIAL